MAIIDNIENSLHIVLKNLIKQKSIRDKIDFTAYQLAKELGMPRSLITSLTHTDVKRRVNNPRISTLLKIVDFFRSDGFNITLEDLLGVKSRVIDIDNELEFEKTTAITISIYPFSYKDNECLGTTTLQLSNHSKNIFGLFSSTDINPLFKAGSIFIIDRDLNPEDSNLVAVRLNDKSNVIIRKYQIKKNKIYLKSLDNTDSDIVLMPTTQIEILGVVIQINPKT